MLTLGGESLRFENVTADRAFVIRLSENGRLPMALRPATALLIKGEHPADLPGGFGLYVIVENGKGTVESAPSAAPMVILPEAYSYLGDGDVMRIAPHRRGVRVLYRRKARSNGILLTEQCNHYCLMCSQPPKELTIPGSSVRCFRQYH